MKSLTDATFDTEIKSGVVLVDFSADWCGPCKMLKPILLELERTEEIRDKVKFFDINVDDNQATSQKFDIMSLPTVIIFKDGVEIKKFVGTVGAGAYLNTIRTLLK